MILFKDFCVVQLKALRVSYYKAFVWKIETQFCGNAEQTNSLDRQKRENII